MACILVVLHNTGSEAPQQMWLFGPLPHLPECNHNVTQKVQHNATVPTTMAESITNRDEWLSQTEKSIQAKVGDQWRRERWSEFLKEAVWWLHNEKSTDDDDTTDAAVGLITHRKTEDELKDAAGCPPKNEAFNRKLEAKGVPPIICDTLSNKCAAEQRRSAGVETTPEHMVPVLLALAVRSMKSGWEKISAECTKSESSTARNNSVSCCGLSQRMCKILSLNTDHVQNAHMWPHSEGGSCPC